jgi:hypothetical protein
MISGLFGTFCAQKCQNPAAQGDGVLVVHEMRLGRTALLEFDGSACLNELGLCLFGIVLAGLF